MKNVLLNENTVIYTMSIHMYIVNLKYKY